MISPLKGDKSVQSNIRKEKGSTIQEKKGNGLTEEDCIMSKWDEYCTELYNHKVTGDTVVLNAINENESHNYQLSDMK